MSTGLPPPSVMLDLELAERLVEQMRREPASVAGVSGLSRLAGAGASRINEIFRVHYHSTPAAVLRRIRIETAAKEVLRSDRPLLDIAFEAGFESASAFHESFRRETSMTPGDYRALRDSASFTLILPRDYSPRYALRMAGRDSESVLEQVRGDTIVRALAHRGGDAVLTIRLERGKAICAVTGQAMDAGGVATAHRYARRILGLTGEPGAFERRGLSDPDLARLIAGRRGLRIPQTATVFEALVWAIVGQQVNLSFAYRLRRTLIGLAGSPVEGGLRAHPTPEQVGNLDYSDLTSRQFSRGKAGYLIDASRRVAAGELDVEAFPFQPATVVHKTLLATRGIGEWTSNYVMMRGCGFADCVPAGDTGLSSGLTDFLELDHRPDAKETIELMKRFAPHRSLATFHLWMLKGDAA